jgi:hypothetical protein
MSRSRGESFGARYVGWPKPHSGLGAESPSPRQAGRVKVAQRPKGLALMRSGFYWACTFEKSSKLLTPSSRTTLGGNTAHRSCLCGINGWRSVRGEVQVALDRQPELTVHGFHSTFRDWAAGQTNFVEVALDHVLHDSAEAFYQRRDMLDRRRIMMEAWARFCMSPCVAKGNVARLQRSWKTRTAE